MTEEEQYILEVNDDEVRCHRPDGTMDSLSWKNLMRVEIVVTEDNPLPATFIALHGPNSTIVIPEGATNADELSEGSSLSKVLMQTHLLNRCLRKQPTHSFVGH